MIRNIDHLTNMPKIRAKKFIQFDKIYGHTLFYDNFVGLSIHDKIIEAYEIDRGFVSLKEINALIDKDGLQKSWNIADNKDIFICECEWWNLNSTTKLYLNYNLPVI